jgi:GDP-4-dehydro-6-deoxy-D-mannose reductase
VGDVSVVRDMIDVRDGVSGIIRLLECGIPGEAYNVCGGTGIPLERVLDTFRRLASVPVEISTDAALLRPLEQRVKIGDPSKLRALGWAPAYPLETTLGDILAYWRASAV